MYTHARAHTHTHTHTHTHAHTHTAVAIIDHMDAASLTIDAEEFHAKYAAAEAKSAVSY